MSRIAVVIDPWDYPFNGTVVSTRRFIASLTSAGYRFQLLALAGPGVGWTFSDDEMARWPSLAHQGASQDATGTIDVASPSATLRRVTVSVSVPGRWRPIEISTLITEMGE